MYIVCTLYRRHTGTLQIFRYGLFPYYSYWVLNIIIYFIRILLFFFNLKMRWGRYIRYKSCIQKVFDCDPVDEQFWLLFKKTLHFNRMEFNFVFTFCCCRTYVPFKMLIKLYHQHHPSNTILCGCFLVFVMSLWVCLSHT